MCHVVVDEVVFRDEGAGAEDGLAVGREVFPRHGAMVQAPTADQLLLLLLLCHR